MLVFGCFLIAVTAGVILMDGHPLIALLGLLFSSIFILARESDENKKNAHNVDCGRKH